MARMNADTISSCRIEQEGREEREVIEVFSSTAFPIFLFKVIGFDRDRIASGVS
jgi:hypothetical protein